MSYYLTDEIVKSLTEYAVKVEQAYRERPLCHFDWKPACISVNELNPSKVFSIWFGLMMNHLKVAYLLMIQ